MSEVFWRGVALLGLVTGAGSLGATVLLWERVGQPRPTATMRAAPAEKAAPGSFDLSGRTGVLARLMSEQRAVARIQLRFGADGVLGVKCTAEAVDGGQNACFGQGEGSGNWSLRGATLCLSAAAINLPETSCYALSGENSRLVLSGSGLLVGTMTLK
jgi:hypothetical protein